MAIESHRGLRLEVTTRPMSGRLVPGRPPRQIRRYLLILPAAMVLVLLVAPMVQTLTWSLSSSDGWGLGNFVAVVTDPGAQRALWHTLLWVVIAVGLVVAGFVLAVLSRSLERWWVAFVSVLILPFGVSALASGAAFRLLFDPVPERGTVSALVTGLTGSSPVWLGPILIWLVLVSSFAWTWLGFAVSLFRAGLHAIPDDVLRRARVEGGWRRELRTQIRMLLPVGSIILLTLVVAAARLFDLVLVATPGPMQDEVDTVAVHWWRISERSGEPGQPAALAFLLFLMLGALALVLSRTMGHPPGLAGTTARLFRRRRRPRPSLGSVAIGAGLSLLWAFPVLVLVATAFRSPADAGAVGWWNAGDEGISLESLGEVSAAGLVGSLSSTLAVALGATALLLVVALFAAPALPLGARPAVASPLVALLTVLAVAPVQMYAVPLNSVFTSLGLAGSLLPLIVVHSAAGLPFAVLILRTALTVTPNRPAAFDALLGQTGPFTALRRIWDKAGAAVVAVAVLEFVLVWNDFIVSFLISGPGSSPLTLVLWGEARQFATSAGTVAASAVVSALVPTVVLLATWRRWVVPGLTGGVLR
jgi:alpha-glucoside transport system permease protein